VDGRGNLTSLAGSTMKASPQFQKKSAAPVTPIPLTTNLFRAQRSPAPATEAIAPVTESASPSSNQLSRVTPDWNRIFSNSSRPATVQPKLKVGAPNDVYEQEADRVADQVMSMPESASVQREMAPEEEEVQTKPLAASITPLVQREAMPEDEELQTKASENSDIQRMDNLEEEEIQTKPLEGSLQREEAPDEEDLQMKSLGNSSIQREELPEEEIQTKPSLQRASDGNLQADISIERQINSSKGGGSPLSDEVRSFMEPRFGADFSQVRVHTDAQADQLNRSVQARAFTTGQDVFFRQGEYNPGSRGGQELIAHELTHVVQQNGGAVQRKQTQLIQRVEVNKDPLAAAVSWRSTRPQYAHLWERVEDWMLPDEKVDIMLENYRQRQDFEYKGAAPAFSNVGDCGTLCDEIRSILEYGFGHKGACVRKEITGPMLIEGSQIVDSAGKRGNVDHGEKWLFVTHQCLEVNGTEFDVLFGQRGCKEHVIGEKTTAGFKFGDDLYVRTESNDPQHQYTKQEINQVEQSKEGAVRRKAVKAALLDDVKIQMSSPATPTLSRSSWFSDSDSSESESEVEGEWEPSSEPTFTFNQFSSTLQNVPQDSYAFETGQMGGCVTIIAMFNRNESGIYRDIIGRHMSGGFIVEQAQEVIANAGNSSKIYLLTDPSNYSNGAPDFLIENGINQVGKDKFNVIRHDKSNYILNRKGDILG